MNGATEMEKALAQAARAFATNAAHARTKAEANLELMGVLLHLGYTRGDVQVLEAPDGQLPPAFAAAASQLLRSRIEHLSRQARSGKPGYDVSRHMLLHRARKRLQAMEYPAGDAQSGAAEGQVAMLPNRLSMVRRPTRPRSNSQLFFSHSPNSPTSMQI